MDEYRLPNLNGPEAAIAQMFAAMRQGDPAQTSFLREQLGYPFRKYGRVASRIAKDMRSREGATYIHDPLLCFGRPANSMPIRGVSACPWAENNFRRTLMDLGHRDEEHQPTIFVGSNNQPFILRKASMWYGPPSGLTLQESALDGVRIPAGTIVSVNKGGYKEGGGVISIADRPDIQVGPMRLAHGEEIFPMKEIIERVSEYVEMVS